MPANFGLLPDLSNRIKNKRERYCAYRDRALKQIEKSVDELLSTRSKRGEETIELI